MSVENLSIGKVCDTREDLQIALFTKEIVLKMPEFHHQVQSKLTLKRNELWYNFLPLHELDFVGGLYSIHANKAHIGIATVVFVDACSAYDVRVVLHSTHYTPQRQVLAQRKLVREVLEHNANVIMYSTCAPDINVLPLKMPLVYTMCWRTCEGFMCMISARLTPKPMIHEDWTYEEYLRLVYNRTTTNKAVSLRSKL
jgi:hypothetical protein